MAIGIISAIGALLTLLLGIWKWVKRVKREERKIADEAQKQFDEAMAAGDASAITAAFARLRKLRG